MKRDYWTNYWLEHSKNIKGKKPQSQVLRTFNKQDINDDKWNLTLSHVIKYLDLRTSDIVLDLCCGNGLITREISKKCMSVTAVDISDELISEINVESNNNIKIIVQDIRDVEFENNTFSKVIIYAGIQYLNYKETLLLFKAVYNWMKIDGIFFIGDIPDINRIWHFYNTKQRESIYFNSIEEEAPIVGTWYNKDFLQKLANYCSFKEVEIIEQHKDMIYSHFRFDMYMKR